MKIWNFIYNNKYHIIKYICRIIIQKGSVPWVRSEGNSVLPIISTVLLMYCIFLFPLFDSLSLWFNIRPLVQGSLCTSWLIKWRNMAHWIFPHISMATVCIGKSLSTHAWSRKHTHICSQCMLAYLKKIMQVLLKAFALSHVCRGALYPWQLKCSQWDWTERLIGTQFDGVKTLNVECNTNN